MSDKLKEHIEQYRDDFELYPYDVNKGWKEIHEHVGRHNHKTVTISWRSVYMIAAGVILLLVGSFIIGNQQISTLPPEILEAQQYYEGKIEARMVKFKSKVDDPQLLQDIEALDQAFSELKNDLKDDAQNAEVVEAMMENYRLKLQILEKILEDIDNNQHEEDNSI